MASAVVSERRASRIPNAVLATALFLFAEAMLFAGLVSGYLVLRSQAGVWPPPGQPRLPLLVTAANSLILLASGRAAWEIVPAWEREGVEAARGWLRRSALLGGAFFAIQGFEWLKLMSHGLRASASVYGGLFYATVGTHALHVAVALGVVGWALGALRRGRIGGAGLRAVRMYWLFVVAVWPVLYLLVYLW